MKVKVNGSELGRVAKILSGIVNPKDSAMSNIRISGSADGLSFYATNGTIAAKMLIPMMGVEDETFCVDGTMFRRIVDGAGKEVEISTDETACSIRTTGRTRIPIVSTELKELEPAQGNEIVMNADDLKRAVDGVIHAAATDESRIILTGIMMETDPDGINLVALDGFQMAIEQVNGDYPATFFPPVFETDESGEEKMVDGGTKIVVPGAYIRKICDSMYPGETIRIATDGKQITFRTEGEEMTCVLLSGTFVDYGKILPQSFKTSVRLKADELRNALRAGQVASEKNNLIRLAIGADEMTVRSRSEAADFEAKVPCQTNGDGLEIGFNEKYISNALKSVSTEYVVMNFNSSTAPEVMKPDGADGIRLTLPVRVMG